MFKLSVVFEKSTGTLLRTEFSESSSSPLISFRGRELFHIQGATGTFQWSQGVQGLVTLLLRFHLQSMDLLPAEKAFLRGGSSSLAASFDYALSKQPNWLCEMFGIQPNGIARARFIFKRINPERKKGGEVTIFINSKQLSPHDISFSFDDRTIPTCHQLMSLLSHLEDGTSTQKKNDHSTFTPPSHLSKSSSNASRRIARNVQAVSMIPSYIGNNELTPDSTIFGFQSLKTHVGNLVTFDDGFGVLISTEIFSVQNIPDFLHKRRKRHIEIIQGITPHTEFLRSLRRPVNLQKDHNAIFGISYVMSIHNVISNESHFSEQELRCMAEPSLLGIGDDPSEPPVNVCATDGELPDSSHADIAIINAPNLRCYITWANVMLQLVGQEIGAADFVHKFEILLQKLWYKLHFLDTLASLNGSQLFADKHIKRLRTSANQEFFTLTKPDPRGGTHLNDARHALLRTSRLAELHEVFCRRIHTSKVA